MKISRGESSSGWSERRQFRMTLIFVILAIILGLVAVSFLLARGTETLVNRAAKVAIGGPIKTAYTALHALDEQNIPLLQSCLSPPLRAKANRIAADWKWMTKDLGRVRSCKKSTFTSRVERHRGTYRLVSQYRLIVEMEKGTVIVDYDMVYSNGQYQIVSINFSKQ